MARLKASWWLDSKSRELIRVPDHFHALRDLEGKFRFDFERSADEERWGESLGLEPGEGWGVLPREGPAALKRRYLILAMKRGWVRVRGHSDLPRLTMEFWRKADGLLASLGAALVRMKVEPSRDIELHELETDTPCVMKASELIAFAGSERLEGAGVSDTGWSSP